MLIFLEKCDFFLVGRSKILFIFIGLYAKAGSIITLTFPDVAVGKLLVTKIIFL
jgi:hypothetical protein